MSTIPVRLGIQQRVLPVYRAPFFDTLAGACEGGLSIFAGAPRPEEAIEDRVTLQKARLASAHNIHILKGPFYLCWQAGLIHWLATWQPEVLIVEANPRYLHTPAAVRWMHDHRRPVIGWGLGAPQNKGRLAGLRNRGRRRFLRQFDTMLTYSLQGAREYQVAGFPANRVFIAPNAAAARPTHPLPERPETFANQRATALFVGRLQPRKRVDLLLRACAALPVGDRPDLWIVGDGPARSELESLAHQVYPKTHFFGAHHGADLEPFFRQADLFILPGTGGLAVQQAMSFGLPVLVAEADGTQSDLVRPSNGWLIRPGDLDSLIFALRQALEDPIRLRRMGRESYRMVAEEINLEAMVDGFCQAIHAALAEQSQTDGPIRKSRRR